jgi:hypothetical protein
MASLVEDHPKSNDLCRRFINGLFKLDPCGRSLGLKVLVQFFKR